MSNSDRKNQRFFNKKNIISKFLMSFLNEKILNTENRWEPNAIILTGKKKMEW